MPDTQQPNLPHELLLRILRDIGSSDKNTLSRCMRVSPIFNALVAPILYRDIVIGNRRNGITDPYSARGTYGELDIPPEKAWMQRKGKHKVKVQGKRKDLAYMRRVEIGCVNAPTLESWMSAGPKKRTATVPSVNSIRLLKRMPSNVTATEIVNACAHVFPNASKFIFDDRLAPRYRTLTRWGKMKSVKTLVSIIDLVPGATLSWDAFGMYSTLDKVIYILAPGALPSVRLISGAPLVADLARLDACEGFEGEMLIVLPDRLEKIDHDTVALLRATIDGEKEILKARLDSLAPPERLAPMEEEPNSKIRYLPLQEYLDTHDWADEFTEEDIESWRAERERGSRSRLGWW